MTDTPSAKSALRCPTCSYSLVGIATIGTCPECGVRYDLTVVFPCDNARDPFLVLFWPWVPLVLSIVFIPLPGIMVVTVPAAVILGAIWLVATPRYARSLAAEHLYPTQRSNSIVRNLRRIGGFPLVALAIANLVWGAICVLSLIVFVFVLYGELVHALSHM